VLFFIGIFCLFCREEIITMKSILKNEWTIALLAIILFMPFLGHVHLFDWDEVNFAESAREMIVSHNYFSVQINFQRFWEKPPLFFWLQVISMKIFGVNEFAARFPNAVCGVVTLVLIFRIGKRIFNENVARIWVMVYLGTMLTFLYFKSGIIDPWFNLFIFLSIYHFYFLTLNATNRIKYAFLAGLFLGLAVLTKGPVALVITLLSYGAYVLINRFKFYINWKELLIILLTITAVCFLWFGVDLVKNGPWFLIQFIEYQIRLFSTSEADHGEPFFYHWWVLLIGCFPASIFFMRGQFVRTNTPQQKAFKKWMLILFWVTLLLFSIVKTKIVHYSSLCWFPLTFLATLCINDLWERKAQLNSWLKALLGLIGLLLAIAITAIPFAMMHKDEWIGMIADVFARGNLQADVHWSWTDSIGGSVLLIGVLTYLISKDQRQKTIILFCSLTICCFLTSILLTPKIEAISQKANIEFFEAQQGKDCYVETVGYKSYAQYFYAKSLPHADTMELHNQWLVSGNIDKPTYLSAKIQDAPRLDTVPGIIKLYHKNGFAFYERLPADSLKR
jgi:4-amino-4-deoxy-L-arabinose transferase-like glycosyltransferase